MRLWKSTADGEPKSLVQQAIADLADTDDEWVSRRSVCVAVVSQHEIAPSAVDTALQTLILENRIEHRGDLVRLAPLE